jgi:hypothetical protein
MRVFMIGMLAIALGGCATNGERVPASSGSSEAPAVKNPLAEVESAADERARVRSSLEQSGPIDAKWTADVATVFSAWKSKGGKPASGVEFASPVCYAQGCLVTATYRDMDSFAFANQSLPESAGFLNWPASKYRSPPEVGADGRVLADWVLFAPEK